MYVRSSLKAGTDLSAHIEQISNIALGFDGDNTISVRYTYNTSESVSHRSSYAADPIMTIALNGYCAKLTGAALDAVRSDPSVEYVEEESILSIDYDYEPFHSPTTGPAGRTLVDRLFPRWTPRDLGAGIDIYVLGEAAPYAA
jgi:Peptidase inhibitor I9